MDKAPLNFDNHITLTTVFTTVFSETGVEGHGLQEAQHKVGWRVIMNTWRCSQVISGYPYLYGGFLNWGYPKMDGL